MQIDCSGLARTRAASKAGTAGSRHDDSEGRDSASLESTLATTPRRTSDRACSRYPHPSTTGFASEHTRHFSPSRLKPPWKQRRIRRARRPFALSWPPLRTALDPSAEPLSQPSAVKNPIAPASRPGRPARPASSSLRSRQGCHQIPLDRFQRAIHASWKRAFFRQLMLRFAPPVS